MTLSPTSEAGEFDGNVVTLRQAFQAPRTTSSQRPKIRIENAASEVGRNDAFAASETGTHRRSNRAAYLTAQQKRFGLEQQGAGIPLWSIHHAAH